MNEAAKGLTNLPQWTEFAGTVGVPGTICIIFMLLVFALLALFLWLFSRPFASFLRELLKHLNDLGVALRSGQETTQKALNELRDSLVASNERHEKRFEGIEGELRDIKGKLDK